MDAKCFAICVIHILATNYTIILATKDPGQTTFTFTVGRGEVIKGWDEGVLAMSQGECAKLTCSPDYAYGSGGFPAWGIMPNSELVFEIELLSFK